MQKGVKHLVQIVTDSAADFEPEELTSMGVTCIPLSVLFGDVAYAENIDLSKNMFYRLLEEQGQFPKTSQPSPYAFSQVFENYMNAGDETVAIFLSSKLSGTYQGAVLAKELCGYKDCYPIDSLCATAGERILVEYAVVLRDAGKSAFDIAQSVDQLKSRISLYACMDTLEYLERGGRISRAAAAIGSVARLKPILHVAKDGSAEIPSKMLGKSRGRRYLLERIEKKKPDPSFPIYVMYTHIKENAELLAEHLRQKGYSIGERQIVNVGAVVGSHIGPNAFGLVYVAAT